MSIPSNLYAKGAVCVDAEVTKMLKKIKVVFFPSSVTGTVFDFKIEYRAFLGTDLH